MLWFVNVFTLLCLIYFEAFLLIILLIWEFVTSALAVGFPLESEWPQVFSSSQDSSQYSGRSQQYCSLDGLHSSSYFQILISKSLYRTECANYNWYHRHLHIPVIWFGCLSGIRWPVWTSKSWRTLYVKFSSTDSGLCIHHLFLMALFCAAIRRDSVSLLRFSFLVHIQVFLIKISLYYHHYYYTPCKFLTPASTDDLSLESEWQQSSSAF